MSIESTNDPVIFQGFQGRDHRADTTPHRRDGLSALDDFRHSFYGPQGHHPTAVIALGQDGGPPLPVAAPQAGADNIQQGQALKGDGGGKIKEDWLQMELASMPQPLRDNLNRSLNAVLTGNPQERAAGEAALAANPKEAWLIFQAAVQQPGHRLNGLVNDLVSADANVQNNAINRLQPLGDQVLNHIQGLLKNDQNGPFAQGLNRLVGDLAGANPQDQASMQRHRQASQALDRLRMIAPRAVDQAIERQLQNPESQLSRAVGRLVTALGSNSWREREAATQALTAMGPPVLNNLESRLPQPDLEVQRRLEQVIARIPEQHTNRIVESMLQAGREALPRTGNAEQDRAVEQRFRNLLEGALRANPDLLVSGLGQYRLNTEGKPYMTFQANGIEEWRALAGAMQRAFDANPRTRGMIARVTPQGQFILGHDQNSAAGGSSLIRVERGQMIFGSPLNFRTVPQDNQFAGMQPPPPATAQEALRDIFVDPFADGMVARQRTQVELPGIPPLMGGLMIPPTVQIRHWEPMRTRREQWYHDNSARFNKIK